jgi:hypothetical protein
MNTVHTPRQLQPPITLKADEDQAGARVQKQITESLIQRMRGCPAHVEGPATCSCLMRADQ